VLVENVVDCSDSPTLHARERYWFESLHAELNKQVPTRTKKEYTEVNLNETNEYQKKYRELNRDTIKEWSKKRRELNKDKKKEYDNLNRDKINKKRRERYALKKLNTLGVDNKKQLKDNSN
jgi:hypothetical protein